MNLHTPFFGSVKYTYSLKATIQDISRYLQQVKNPRINGLQGTGRCI